MPAVRSSRLSRIIEAAATSVVQKIRFPWLFSKARLLWEAWSRTSYKPARRRGGTGRLSYKQIQGLSGSFVYDANSFSHSSLTFTFTAEQVASHSSDRFKTVSLVECRLGAFVLAPGRFRILGVIQTFAKVAIFGYLLPAFEALPKGSRTEIPAK